MEPPEQPGCERDVSFISTYLDVFLWVGINWQRIILIPWQRFPNQVKILKNNKEIVDRFLAL